MIARAIFFLGGLLLVQSQSDDAQFQQQGFIRPVIQPIQGFSNMFTNQQSQKIGASRGSGAAAGQAGTLGGMGQVTSINQANQLGTKDMTQASGISANTAVGNGATAGGAAQAGGEVNSAEQTFQQIGRQQGLQQGRKRRQAYGGYPYGYRSLSQNIANANAVGGGSAQYGQIATNNNAWSNTNPNGATGFANGNTNGIGQGISLFNAVHTNAQSGNQRGGW